MNKVILIGRLTKDPEINHTQGEKPTAIAKFTLAVDRRVKREGEQTADFIQCMSFGKTTEFIEKYIHKGTKVAISGRWQTGSYTNKDGQRVYTNTCVIEDIEFAESRAASQSNQNVANDQTANDGFANVSAGIEDDLPFH